MKKIAIVGLISWAVIATAALAQQVGQRRLGMQGMMGAQKPGEQSGSMMQQGMPSMMGMMMRMMDQCTAMMSADSEEKKDSPKKSN